MSSPASNVPAGSRPAPAAPSWGWVMRRAALGLIIMFAVTGLAAYIAHASIETPLEPASSIEIGTPAGAILKRN